MDERQTEEFLTRLEGPGGCEFKGPPEKPTWTCKGGHDQSLSRAILKKMEIPDGEATEFLARCTALGGHCDCEILFNAADTLRGQTKATAAAAPPASPPSPADPPASG